MMALQVTRLRFGLRRAASAIFGGDQLERFLDLGLAATSR
jgi:hypothetical protein